MTRPGVPTTTEHHGFSLNDLITEIAAAVIGRMRTWGSLAGVRCLKAFGNLQGEFPVGG